MMTKIMLLMMMMMMMIRIVWSLAKLAPSLPLPSRIRSRARTGGQKWPENTAQCGCHDDDRDDHGHDGHDGHDDDGGEEDDDNDHVNIVQCGWSWLWWLWCWWWRWRWLRCCWFWSRIVTRYDECNLWFMLIYVDLRLKEKWQELWWWSDGRMVRWSERLEGSER